MKQKECKDLHNIFVFLLYLFVRFVHVNPSVWGHGQAAVSPWSSEGGQLAKLVPALYLVGPEDGAQVIRLGDSDFTCGNVLPILLSKIQSPRDGSCILEWLESTHREKERHTSQPHAD